MQELNNQLNTQREELGQRIGFEVPLHLPTIEFLSKLSELADKSPDLRQVLGAPLQDLCNITQKSLSPEELDSLKMFLEDWYSRGVTVDKFRPLVHTAITSFSRR